MRVLSLFLILIAAAPLLADSPDEQLAAASALFDARKHSEAAKRLETFLQANPRHPKAGAAALALGRCYTELKQFPKAVPAYEKAVASKDPAVVPIAQLGLGEATIYSGQYEKAAGALNAAVKTPLKPEQAALAWYWLGQANFQLRRYAPAEEAYLKVTRDFGKSDLADAAHFGAGLAALRQDRGDVARQRLRVVVDRYPKSADRPRSMLILAQLDMDGKQYREARSGFEAVLADPAAKADAEMRGAAEEGLVRALLELRDYPAATSRLEAVLARLPATDPQRPRAQISLGHSRYRQKQYEPALAAYREAARSTEEAVAAEGFYWAANTALALNRPTDAATEFGKVAARFPKHALAARAQLKAGDALLAAKQTDAATTAYRTVLERYPQAPEAGEARKALAGLVDSVNDPAQLAAALKSAPPAERARGSLRLARLYLQAKKYPQAEAPLSEVVKAKPAPEVAAEAQYLLGLVYEAQEKSAPAAAALAEAVRVGKTPAPWTADAQARLAWLYLELKQPANAERAAAAALALKPAAELERGARLAQLQAQLDQQKWDAALEGSRVLLAANPPPETVATVLFTQAWVNEKRGKGAEALPLWERLAAEHPRSSYAPEALLHVADARFKAAKYEDARQKYSALVTGFPKSPLAPEARFKLGSALYNLERYAEAGVEFDAVAAAKEAGEYAPEALYWAGLALDKAGKKDGAMQRLTRLVAEHPAHARVANAKVRLAALKAVSGK